MAGSVERSRRLRAVGAHLAKSSSALRSSTASAEQLDGLRLTPISPHLGAEVEGVDLKQPLSPAQVSAVYDALLRHKVLVFKRIGLSHAEQVRFTYELSGASPHVGEPTIGHTVFGHAEGFPEIYSVYQGDRIKPKNMEKYTASSQKYPWTGYHCDITACVNPPCIGMLRGDTIPEGAGDTNFGNLARAFETLSDEMKERILHMTAEHEYKIGGYTAQSIADRKMISHHPLVTVHPDTGERILYNSPGFLKFITGMPFLESKALLHELWGHSVEYTIQHKWSEGDLVVWVRIALSCFC